MTWLVSLLLACFPLQDGQTADKGPIHEAFAQPVDAKSVRGPLLATEPPKPIREEPPEDKPEGDNVLWIDGYWHHDTERSDYLWISGFWRQAPPGQKWMPGHFEREAGGWRWYSGYWQAEEQVDQEPESEQPPASLDIGPTIPAPRADMTWAPGFYVRRDRVWAWRPGTWISYRPGWVWNPAQWVYTRRGFVFVQGYWDYPLEYRGVIYAPVYYPPAVIVRPGFCHRPSLIIVNNDLSCGLFARPGFGMYYFGNYFTPVYANQGFVFWATPRPMFRPDPIFAYYRQARDPAWVAGVQDYGRLRVQGKTATAPTLALASSTGPKPPLARPAGDNVRLVAASQQGKVVLKNTAPPPPKTDIPASQVIARPIKPGTTAVKPNTVLTDGKLKDAKGKELPKDAKAMADKDAAKSKASLKDQLKESKSLTDKDSAKSKGSLKDQPRDSKPVTGKDMPKDPQRDLPKTKDFSKDLPKTKDAIPAQPKDRPAGKPAPTELNRPMSPTRDNPAPTVIPPMRGGNPPSGPVSPAAKPMAGTGKTMPPGGSGPTRPAAAPLGPKTGEPEKNPR